MQGLSFFSCGVYSSCAKGGWWTLGLIVEGNSADHSGWSNEVMVTKTRRLITYNKRHIQKAPITEQYLREQIVKGIGCLEIIFTDTNPIKHNRVFNPYTASNQVNTLHSDTQKGTMQTSRSRRLVQVQIWQMVGRAMI